MDWGTMATIGLGIGGGLWDWYQTKRQADRQAGAYEYNARKYKEEAKYQKWRTQVRLKQLREYKDQLISRQRVAFAKAGVVVDKNTAKQVVLDTARKFDADKEILLMEGKFNVRRAKEGAAAMLASAADVVDWGWWQGTRILMNTAADVMKVI